MANPKRRHSTIRQNTRRSQWKLSKPGLTPCPRCKKPKLPHFMCPNCGYYNGKEIVNMEKKKENKDKKDKKDKKEKKENKKKK